MEANLNNMKNILVVYKGGGYDGCIHEPNYAFFDNDGNFHNILATGVFGADTLEKLKKRIIEIEEEDSIRNYCNYYNVFKEKDIDDFSKFVSSTEFLSIAKWLFDWQDIKIYGKCSECEEKFPATELIPTDYQSCGGIVVKAFGQMCENCHCNHTCFECGKFYSNPADDFDENGRCEYCQIKNCTGSKAPDNLEDFIFCIDYEAYLQARHPHFSLDKEEQYELLTGKGFDIDKHFELARIFFQGIEYARENQWLGVSDKEEILEELHQDVVVAFSKYMNDKEKQLVMFGD